MLVYAQETTMEQFELFRGWFEEQAQMHSELVSTALERGETDIVDDLEPYQDMFQNMCADLRIPGWEV